MLLPLTQGLFAKVDADNFEFLAGYRWSLNNGKYARNAKLGAMHRFLLDAPKGVQVDHINGDTLDNRMANLRFATQAQNTMNKHVAWGRSKYKGVVWSKKLGSWLVRIQTGSERIFVGSYRDEIEAAEAYNKASLESHSEFGWLNVIDGYTTGTEQARPAKRLFKRDKPEGFRGVSLVADRGHFNASIQQGSERRQKKFTDKFAAAAWYNLQAREMYGSDALVNQLPGEYLDYERIVASDPLAFTPKVGKLSKTPNVFKNGKTWMVRFKKGKETIFQRNFKTEPEAVEAAEVVRKKLELGLSVTKHDDLRD